MIFEAEKAKKSNPPEQNTNIKLRWPEFRFPAPEYKLEMVGYFL